MMENFKARHPRTARTARSLGRGLWIAGAGLVFWAFPAAALYVFLLIRPEDSAIIADPPVIKRLFYFIFLAFFTVQFNIYLDWRAARDTTFGRWHRQMTQESPLRGELYRAARYLAPWIGGGLVFSA